MKLKEWGVFALLGLVWGSSFLWIKVAVQEVGPFMLVTLRLFSGLVGLLVIMRLRRLAFPRERRILLAYLFMGLFNTALPFTLISWGETQIDSGLASILNGAVPLFTIVIAHFWLHDEKITLPRIGGLIVGFIGVVVLVSRDLQPGALSGSILGQLAVIAASISYAVAITFSRKYLRGQSPVVQSTMVMLVANGLMWTALPIAEPLRFPALPMTWVAVLWLGLLGSCLAYLMFFYLINAWGPTRASLVTYVFPVIGLVLGVLFLRESVDWSLLVGSLLVVGGIVIVNFNTLFRAPAAVPPLASKA
jgi:drug/metabolite transporter (DMT)-like permease